MSRFVSDHADQHRPALKGGPLLLRHGGSPRLPTDRTVTPEVGRTSSVASDTPAREFGGRAGGGPHRFARPGVPRTPDPRVRAVSAWAKGVEMGGAGFKAGCKSAFGASGAAPGVAPPRTYRTSALRGYGQQGPIVDLAVVKQDVRVHVTRHARRALPDKRSDFGPRASLPVQHRNPPVAQIVG